MATFYRIISIVIVVVNLFIQDDQRWARLGVALGCLIYAKLLDQQRKERS